MARASIVFTLLGGGCTAPAPSVVDTRLTTANSMDLLFMAVQEIGVRCPDFGQKLLGMYYTGGLLWDQMVGDHEYGYADYGTMLNPGTIHMELEKYLELSDLEMLIADLYHEAAHSFLGEDDWKDANDVYITTTSFGREGMAMTSYDVLYNEGRCPDVLN